jgi:nucleoside 2-deoxyribosyltransferase
MTLDLHIVGGVYRERCQWPLPETDQVFGSAGRAAAALQGTGIQRVLHTYAGPDLKQTIEPILGGFDVQINVHDRRDDPVFDYIHCLAIPTISPDPVAIASAGAIHLKAERVIRFGMLEGDAIVDADMCVYDPQSSFRPGGFRVNGSTARRLAIVANAGELRALARESDVEAAARKTLLAEQAEVVVAKCGLDGALIVTASNMDRVPAFAVSAAHTIGSGDVFVAVFAKAWMFDNFSPSDAALAASTATANYIETSVLPVDLVNRGRSAVLKSSGKVYLAGPFFTIPQRWMVEEALRVMRSLKIDVFSPLHDVGRGSAAQVVPKDIAAIQDCDAMLALADGLDSGTVFEVGYARAIGKPVYVFAQRVTEQDLKMMVGSKCIVSDDFASLVLQLAQRA